MALKSYCRDSTTIWLVKMAVICFTLSGKILCAPSPQRSYFSSSTSIRNSNTGQRRDDNFLRRGNVYSQRQVFAAHPTQLPFTERGQHHFQRRQYQHQQTDYNRGPAAPPAYFKATSNDGGSAAAIPAYPVTPQPQTPKDVVPILAYSNDITFDGTYSYNYETGDGMYRQESGQMVNVGTPEEAQTVTGSYSYTAPDGQLIRVTYVADANGFRAEGEHLPTPPPIPEAILKSLEYIAAKQREAPAVPSDQYNPQYQQNRLARYRGGERRKK